MKYSNEKIVVVCSGIIYSLFLLPAEVSARGLGSLLADRIKETPTEHLALGIFGSACFFALLFIPSVVKHQLWIRNLTPEKAMEEIKNNGVKLARACNEIRNNNWPFDGNIISQSLIVEYQSYLEDATKLSNVEALIELINFRKIYEAQTALNKIMAHLQQQATLSGKRDLNIENIITKALENLEPDN